MSGGSTIWLTGLSGAGKTTIAQALAAELSAVGNRVQVLDGDELRTNLSAGLGFSRQDRNTHVERVGFVAQLLATHGVTVIVPVIAPYADARARVRSSHETRGLTFREVYVATSLQECRRRDVKGLYARSAAGEIAAMTGVDDPYEPPTDPDLVLDTEHVSIDAAVARVRSLLTELKETA
ncbi:adenylyl-sulfate kinase [Rudaeicoccus suwonensis]|uniref:Adenylyl-sulfate kinase n=1 Tax=Rudaeicoccus suwonensis TaxID=657409 RepID=A0A561E9J5_9MICO|nr:adenylyl-sulfate kinase [Rudaeicoccus suwonensis]TWE12282.1 adenylylsulfate kinase [Rudaeicoccus suwonensis]